MSDMTRPATAALLTLGCKLNIADSEVMARRLRAAGWSVVDRPVDAEAVIVNTCSVTHVADQKSRHALRMARRIAPSATIAVTGCLLETSSLEMLDSLDADLVYGQPDQIALADRLIALHPHAAVPEAQAQVAVQSDEAVRPGLKTRAFISAQEGCNDVCAFCIIPKTRGRERSKTVAWMVEEAQRRQAEGVQELVITGTQLGHYGSDIGASLHDLLKALLTETDIPRIRMSSVQPQDLSDELIGLWANARLCRHFHLSLQSGSEAVLRRMRRRYVQSQYRDAVMKLRAAVPGIAITTDVIAGFPGETESEFEESYAFCEEMAFAAMHVFPYSERPGTSATRLPDQLALAVKKQRVHDLMALADRMSRTYREGLIGETPLVLWENRREGGIWEGLTDTYVRVRAGSEANLKNRLTGVRVIGIGREGLEGEVLA